jgi:hypothetical protein
LSADSKRSGKSPVEANSSMFSREYLVRLKRKAWRSGCWFRDLKQNERVLLNLTIKVVEKVRSFILTKLLSHTVDKLLGAMESRIYRLIRVEGKSMARELSEIAQGWGYNAAKGWAKDRGFMQFLVVNSLGELRK